MAGRVWQIASGAWGRDYADTFIAYDVMLMGPGDPGSFTDEVYGALVKEGIRTKEYIGALASFCRGAEEGDYILLRQGLRIVGIGLVASNEYLYTLVTCVYWPVVLLWLPFNQVARSRVSWRPAPPSP